LWKRIWGLNLFGVILRNASDEGSLLFLDSSDALRMTPINNFMNTEILLQLKNVSVHFGGVKALDNVSLEIFPGEIVALMGPNGAGKSTILKAIFGLANISSGEILWHGAPLVAITHQMVSLGIAFVPQGRRMLKHLSVEENLDIGGYCLNNSSEIKRRKQELLDLFPILKHKRKEKSGLLSGGQQQMLAIARGLMTEPKILLLDEPTLGLSPIAIKEVFSKIIEINQRHKTAIVIVEHNLKTILEMVNRAYVLANGKIVTHGLGKEIIHSDILEKVFLGKN
jgi:branched-chain amino acid transport system ATP-binding protein